MDTILIGSPFFLEHYASFPHINTGNDQRACRSSDRNTRQRYFDGSSQTAPDQDTLSFRRFTRKAAKLRRAGEVVAVRPVLPKGCFNEGY